jgi:hypothetical protein
LPKYIVALFFIPKKISAGEIYAQYRVGEMILYIGDDFVVKKIGKSPSPTAPISNRFASFVERSFYHGGITPYYAP